MKEAEEQARALAEAKLREFFVHRLLVLYLGSAFSVQWVSEMTKFHLLTSSLCLTILAK